MPKIHLLMSDGLFHLGYKTLFNTKGHSGDNLDAAWDQDIVKRDFVSPNIKASIQGARYKKATEREPAKNADLISGEDWIERRKKLAAVVGLDIQNPNEAKKLASFTATFNQIITGNVALDIANRLELGVGMDGKEKGWLGMNARTYNVSYENGRFLVSFTQPFLYFKKTEDFRDAYEQAQNVEEFEGTQSDFAVSLIKKQEAAGYKGMEATYVLELDPEKNAFILKDNQITVGDDLFKLIKNKNLSDRLDVMSRADIFIERQISVALKNEGHSSFVKNYDSFLKQLPKAIKASESSPKVLLGAGLESAVIEFANNCKLALEGKVNADTVSLSAFSQSLEDYCNTFSKKFPAYDYNREKVKADIMETTYGLINLYAKYHNKDDMDKEKITTAFTNVNVKNDHVKFTNLQEAMRNSLIANIIEKQAAAELLLPLENQQGKRETLLSVDSGLGRESDTASVHSWRAADSRVERSEKSSAVSPSKSDKNDDDDWYDFYGHGF